MTSNPTPEVPEVTADEREEFLQAQGWTPDMDPAARAELEAYWTDADIKMARGLNLS